MSIYDMMPWLPLGNPALMWGVDPLRDIQLANQAERESPVEKTEKSVSECSLLGALHTPAVDVEETEQDICVMAELPGVGKEDVDIWVQSDHLMFSGEKRIAPSKESVGYSSRERYSGSFCRMIPLPCEVDFDKAEATFKNGVLTIRMPKTEEARRRHRKIEIKSES